MKTLTKLSLTRDINKLKNYQKVKREYNKKHDKDVEIDIFYRGYLLALQDIEAVLRDKYK